MKIKIIINMGLPLRCTITVESDIQQCQIEFRKCVGGSIVLYISGVAFYL